MTALDVADLVVIAGQALGVGTDAALAQADITAAQAAAVVVEALASGRLSPDNAAAWLSPRLSPHPAPRVRRAGTQVPLPSLRPLRTLPVTRIPARRVLMSAMLAMATGGVALLATACSQGAAPAGTHTAGQPPAARHSPEPAATRASELAYAACMRSHGIEKFPGPSASAVIIIPATGVDVHSLQFRSAERTCQQIAPVPPAHIVIADEGYPGS